EGFQEMPLFSSERVRLVGKVLLYLVGIALLGLPWLLILGLGRLTRRPASVGWVESSRPTSSVSAVGLEDSTHPTRTSSVSAVGLEDSTHPTPGEDGKLQTCPTTSNGHTTNGQDGAAALPEDDVQGMLS